MKLRGGGRFSTGAPSGSVARKTATFALVAHHHRHVAGLIEERHEAVFVRLRHALVVRLVERAARHVLHRAVGVMREHHELLLAAAIRMSALPSASTSMRASVGSVASPYGMPCAIQRTSSR